MGAPASTLDRIRRHGAAASLALAALLGGGALPLLVAVTPAETAPFCGGKGRCCCADAASAADERPCLRRGCGCELKDAGVGFGPLRLEAVLPAGVPACLEPHIPGPTKVPASVLSRPHAPPVPPPRSAPAA